jgi:hypothetical protein
MVRARPKQQREVKARSLFCFWPACAGTADRAVSELGMSLRDLARRLEMSPVAWDSRSKREKPLSAKMGCN